MKIRFYPKTTTVIGMVHKAIEAEQAVIAGYDKAIEEIANAKLYTGRSAGQYEQAKAEALTRVKSLQDKLEAMESHSPPEVMAEVDL